MPSAALVTPDKWTNKIVLFDDDRYSVISGLYDGDHMLGERWNGEGDAVGFPNQGGNPTWFVVPAFLSRPILYGLLNELAAHPEQPHRAEYIEAILRELSVQLG